MKMLRAVVGLVTILSGSVVGAKTHHVGGVDAEYATVEAALAAAVDGDVVELASGTFETVSDELRVTNAVSVVGQGAGVTIVKAVNAAGAKKTGSQIHRRCFFVNHPKAVVKNLTMTDGFWYNYGNDGKTDYDTSGACGGGDLVLYAGTVSGCLITGTRHGNSTADGGGSNGGGVWMSGGTITNCTITGCKAVYNNGASGVGGGIYMTNGLVVDSEIFDNWAGQSAEDVYIKGGTLLRCHVKSVNPVSASSTVASVYIEGSGLVRDCVVSGHSGLRYAGVYVAGSGAVLRNCLVFGNTGVFEGSGVYLKNGRVEHCTVTGNAAQQATVGTGFYQTGGVAVNNVIFGNPAGLGGDTVVSDGSFTYNLTTVPVPGEGNRNGKAHFVDAANGDFRLLAGSGAIDAATPLEAVAADIDGIMRPAGAAPDMGCYEFVPGTGKLTVTVNGPETTTFADRGTATFVATLGGESTEDAAFTWFFDGVQQSATGPSLTVENFGIGSHEVRVVVQTATETAEAVEADAVRVSTRHAYVNAAGGNVFPYDTMAKGAHRVQDALDAVVCSEDQPGEVTVAPGAYCPNAKWFELTRPVRLVAAEGPDVTSLYGNDPNGTSCDGRRVGRVLRVNHPSAYVEGFTVSNGWWYSSAGDSGPGGMRLSAGLVTNCVFTLNRGGDLGGAVQMSGGTLTGCVIHDNYTRYNNDAVNTRGGGVYMTGGLVERCRIFRNWAAVAPDTGSGVWMNGGTMRNCDIYDNFSRNTNARGLGVCVMGGLVECCAITNNGREAQMTFPKNSKSVTVNNGCGVYLAGGTLRNCLVAGNRAMNSGSGVYQVGGTLEYCTVTANESVNKVNSGLYLEGKDAVVRYNIISGNGAGLDTEPNGNIVYKQAKDFSLNLVTPATAGTDNIDHPAGFTDAANRDWTLATGSQAIDAGAADDGVGSDRLGNARPKDGDGDGVARNDLGCYEAEDASVSPLACAFTPESTQALESAVVAFSAIATGRGADGELTYAWDFGGGEVLSGAHTATPTVRFSNYGSYAVKLTVTSAAGDEAERAVPACVRIGTSRVFVDAAGENPVWPYDTPETAATDLEEALGSLVLSDQARATVTVAPGTYEIQKKTLLISYPVRLVSAEGPDVTVLKARGESNTNRRCLEITHPDAFVSGFSLTDAAWDPWFLGDPGAAALRMTAGVVSNCVVTGAYAGRSNCGAVSVKGTGLLTHTVIRNSFCDQASSSGASQFGGGLELSENGVATHLVISNCYAQKGGDCSGGGVAVYGGTLSDSRILDCYINSSGVHGSAVYLTGGTIDRCVIGDSRSHDAHGAAIYQTGGLLCNSLVFGARAQTAAQALYMTGGTFANNTVVTNGFKASTANPVAAVLEGGTVVNSLFALNAGGDVSRTGGEISFSRFGEATAAQGNTAADPRFRSPARGDWRIRGSSPCLNAGVNQQWMETATDLAGNPRVLTGRVDIGCYENRGGGLMLIFR